MQEELTDVAVVGGGASGALVAAHLLRACAVSLRVTVVDSRESPARGLAYSTESNAHLLNVPAEKMSAFPDLPGHFAQWLAARAPGATAGTFARRRQYGAYLEEVLRGETAAGKATLVRDEVVGLSPLTEGLRLSLSSGKTFSARACVLATGHSLPGQPRVPDEGFFQSARYHRSPWSAQALRAAAEGEDPVFLLGTGLTMLDVVLALRERGFHGPIHALSRHGYLPQVHAKVTPSPWDPKEKPPQELRALMRAVRERAASGENDWRAVVDALRPHTQALWAGFSLEDQHRFLRHVRSHWDVHRHRMAPEVDAEIADSVRSGQLRVLAGRIIRFRPREEGVEIRYRQRGDPTERVLRAGHVFNCTGPGALSSGGSSPLLSALLAQGSVTEDALGLGLRTDPEGRLLDRKQAVSPGLYTLSVLRRGALWESTAVPEIRTQAHALAHTVLADLGKG